MSRSLARYAVMFADLVGSTRIYTVLGNLDGRSVVEAFVQRSARVAQEHGGRLVKAVGDAALSVFPFADQALRAASALQQQAASQPCAGEKVRLHIGIHYGDLMEEGRDVFGDTVNLAAYLSDMASPEQILTSEATYRILSEELKAICRPIFQVRIKDTARETVIYQVLWDDDSTTVIDLNMDGRRLLPADPGGLVLTHRCQRITVDRFRYRVVIGRAPHCDVRLADRFVSREHAIVRLEGVQFYLTDSSINGTVVEFEDGRSVQLLRREISLESAGWIWPGGKRGPSFEEAVRFERDRRSLYRV
jgi:adenylate cyclase